MSATLEIIGTGEPAYVEMLVARTRDLPIVWHGALTPGEVRSHLAAAHFFVFPTVHRGEGHSNALTEAMASGHACVSYDISVVREVLGDTGLLVPLDNPVALVGELAKLVRHPALIDAYAARSHERAREFSWDDARRSIEQIARDTVRNLQGAGSQ